MKISSVFGFGRTLEWPIYAYQFALGLAGFSEGVVKDGGSLV